MLIHLHASIDVWFALIVMAYDARCLSEALALVLTQT